MNKNIVRKGDVILVIIDKYGVVYEGLITCGMDEHEDKRNGNLVVFTQPQGWCLGTRELKRIELHSMSDPTISSNNLKYIPFHTSLKRYSNLCINNKNVRQRAQRLGYCWIAYARLQENVRNIR